MISEATALPPPGEQPAVVASKGSSDSAQLLQQQVATVLREKIPGVVEERVAALVASLPGAARDQDEAAFAALLRGFLASVGLNGAGDSGSLLFRGKDGAVDEQEDEEDLSDEVLAGLAALAVSPSPWATSGTVIRFAGGN